MLLGKNGPEKYYGPSQLGPNGLTSRSVESKMRLFPTVCFKGTSPKMLLSRY